MPKSSTFAPAGESMTLPGLMSRCTSPRACAAASAAATCAPTSSAAGAGSGPDRSRSARVGPWTSSITTYGTGGPEPSADSP